MAQHQTSQPLVDRMNALADSGHPRAAELHEAAGRLRGAADGYWSDTPTVSVGKFMGAWARARKLWCDCTGEPLL